MNWLIQFWKALGGESTSELSFEEPLSTLPTSLALSRVLEAAHQQARRLQRSYIGTEHLLLAIIEQEQCQAHQVLKQLGCNPEAIRRSVVELIGTGQGQTEFSVIRCTPRVFKVMKSAGKEAQKLNCSNLGTVHLLLGLIIEGSGVAGRVLQGAGLDYDKIRQGILEAGFAGKVEE